MGWSLNPKGKWWVTHNIHATFAMVCMYCHAGQHCSSQVSQLVRFLKTFLPTPCVAPSGTMKGRWQGGHFQLSTSTSFLYDSSMQSTLISCQVSHWTQSSSIQRVWLTNKFPMPDFMHAQRVLCVLIHGPNPWSRNFRAQRDLLYRTFVFSFKFNNLNLYPTIEKSSEHEPLQETENIFYWKAKTPCWFAFETTSCWHRWGVWPDNVG